MSSNKDVFMRQVQAHERAWGDKTYPGKPSLAEIMQSPVVAFWEAEKKNRRDPDIQITLHKDLGDIEFHLSRMILRIKLTPPNKRFIRAFVRGEEVRIVGFRVLFKKVSEIE